MRYFILIIFLGLVWTPNALAQGFLPSPLTIEIRTMDTCLDVPGGNPSDHVPLQMFPCHGGPNQRWLLRFDFAGFVIIASESTGKCLDVPGGTSGVQQFRCHGGDNQRWQLFHDRDTLRFRIQPKVSTLSNRCLQVGDDRQLGMSRCDETVGAAILSPGRWSRQNFEFIVHPSSDFDILVNEDREWCLDVAGLRQDDGAPIQHYPCNRGANQLWRIVRHADGFVAIQAQHSGKCLRWDTGIGRRGVSQASCVSGQDEQKWHLQLTSNGRVHIQTKRPVCLQLPTTNFPAPKSLCECLDAPSDSNFLRVESCATSADQWRLGIGQRVNGALTFFKDNNVTGRPLCGLLPATAEYNFTRHRACENDDARSLLLVDVRKDTVIEVFDDSRCRTRDDWTRITVKRNIARYNVNTFELSTEDNFIKVEYMTRGNLDGKVSCVRIQSP